MAADAGLLPTIKCSTCGINVEIMSMGDHVCQPAQPPSPPPPPPPLKDSWDAKPAKGPPPRIDPSAANRPFTNSDGPGVDQDGLTPAPLSTQRSPNPQRSAALESPDKFDMGADLPAFPIPRSMSTRRAQAANLKDASSAPPVPSPQYANAMNLGVQDDHQPRSANLPLEDSAPPPLPKDEALPPPGHRYGDSIASKSSYRTSLASSQYGDGSSKRSTAVSSRLPSFTSVSMPYRYEDVPPIPSANPRNASHISTSSEYSVAESGRLGPKDNTYSGFDFGMLNDKTDSYHPSPLRVSSHVESERFSSGSRGSRELFFQSPSHSMHGPPDNEHDFAELAKEHPHSLQEHVDYRAFKPSGSDYLQPTNPETANDARERKNSDASDGGLSVSNFARSLGWEGDQTVESSTNSSDSSPSETRSGTSLSSLPSEASLSRRKPSDQGKLGPVVEDPTTLHENPTILVPPKITDPHSVPDSPTDPALNHGSLALIREQPSSPETERNDDSMSEKPALARSATEPIPGPPPTPRLKGRCKGCGEAITGKSISSKDGRLTGRYHRNCFVCFHCKVPFQTADFYVLNDLPFCAEHYHTRNGSMCQTCHTGIEGHYLETVERNGFGPGDRVKFHPDCLTCRTCNVLLKGEYFEWNGLVYCERDARRAAASVSPHRFRRPTLPSSPLAGGPPGPPGRGFGPPPPGFRGRGYGPPPGRGRGMRPPMPPPGMFDGPGPYGPPGPGSAGGDPYLPPPGPRRFPERRTTRLMMI